MSNNPPQNGLTVPAAMNAMMGGPESHHITISRDWKSSAIDFIRMFLFDVFASFLCVCVCVKKTSSNTTFDFLLFSSHFIYLENCVFTLHSLSIYIYITIFLH
jgi:hypothetical protein